MATTNDGAVSREAALAALDCGVVPLLVVADRARIIHANRAAGALLAAGRAFRTVGGRLAVQRQADQDAIEAAVAAALASGERRTINLTNRQGDVNHVLTVSPLPMEALGLLVIAELRAPVLLRRNWSRDALALPPAYAELAEALVAGENLAEFADRTGLSVGGSRTRLKKLLRRLGTRSQADLVGLLLKASTALTLP